MVEPIGLDADSLARPIEWAELFGNDHSVEMEIGMGKGTFLTEQAAARSDTNFFGIEWASWYWRYASDRLRRHNCLNVRTVRAEAMFFIREHVADNSLSVVHIYFPDPWPKKRHHKRRLIQADTLTELARVLVPGGQLRFASDWADYVDWSLLRITANPAFRWTAETAADWRVPPADHITTRYEEKRLGDCAPVFLDFLRT